jgi:hypothetical protein
MKRILLGLGAVLLIVLLGIGAVWAFSDKPGMGVLPGSQTATSTSPRVQPVGIVTPEKEATVAALKERILKNGIYLTPLAVVEDSRCPTDVQCIQAGTVRLQVRLEVQGKAQTQTLTLSKPFLFGGKNITLINVTPAKSSSTNIAASDYRFSFSFSFADPSVVSGALSGVMTIGPICPVERVDTPCNPTPEMYAAHKVVVYTADRKTLLATLIPNAQGAFSASFPAGSYYVTMAQTPPAVGSATGVPATLVIQSGATTHLAIDVDTGIR